MHNVAPASFRKDTVIKNSTSNHDNHFLIIQAIFKNPIFPGLT